MNEIVARWFDDVLAESGPASAEEQRRLEAQVAELERDGAILASSESLRRQVDELTAEVRALEAEEAAGQERVGQAQSAHRDLLANVTARLFQDCQSLLDLNRAAAAAEIVAAAGAWEPLRKEASKILGLPLGSLPPGQMEKL